MMVLHFCALLLVVVGVQHFHTLLHYVEAVNGLVLVLQNWEEELQANKKPVKTCSAIKELHYV